MMIFKTVDPINVIGLIVFIYFVISVFRYFHTRKLANFLGSIISCDFGFFFGILGQWYTSSATQKIIMVICGIFLSAVSAYLYVIIIKDIKYDKSNAPQGAIIGAGRGRV